MRDVEESGDVITSPRNEQTEIQGVSSWRGRRFPYFRQLDQMDCGPTCLRMIAKHYGRSYSGAALREKSFLTRGGVSLLGISEAAESIGMRSLGMRLSLDRLAEVSFPCITHWKENHFVVVHQIRRGKVYVADPAEGLLVYREEEFLKGWSMSRGGRSAEGSVLTLEPTPEFYRLEGEKERAKTSWSFLFGYLFRYRSLVGQLLLGLFLGTVLSLMIPFLTQAVVDFGVNNQNPGFVITILVAQLMLFAGRTAVEFIRGWILLHLSTRVNLAILSDFLIKLMKLPLSFFDSKSIGDIMQRIGDHNRIQTFLSTTTLSVLFSVFNLLVYGFVLLAYSSSIFLVFSLGSFFSFGWMMLFLKRRRFLDDKRFGELAEQQGSLIQLVQGMPEIKLNNAERSKRWEWEHIQARLFRTKVKGLGLTQYQDGGTNTLAQLSNVLITFFSARAVIDGEMTLGMMMAVQYIVGQLSAPLSQIINFVRAFQDAKISLDRLGEVHSHRDEEDEGIDRVTEFPEDRSLHLRDVTFQYEGPHSQKVLKNLTMTIPEGKVTAIVGGSGSGKTTLLKLLLKFYEPSEGEISLGSFSLASVSSAWWRERCGVVMQDGFIFDDTVARNIALDPERQDRVRLFQSAKIANVGGFVESLPLGYGTKIGADGHGLSVGQKQRVLIARAIYKNPEYLFFDEATSSLDANNEREIMEKLGEFFKGRTVVVIAHRLSTVKNADQIVVLEEGEIREQGDHESLTKLRGAYFHLVKNQLELGN